MSSRFINSRSHLPTSTEVGVVSQPKQRRSNTQVIVTIVLTVKYCNTVYSCIYCLLTMLAVGCSYLCLFVFVTAIIITFVCVVLHIVHCLFIIVYFPEGTFIVFVQL